MNFSAEQLAANMSPFLSGTQSPAPGANFGQASSNAGPSSTQVPPPSAAAMAAALNAAAVNSSNPALAYANAQLAQYAQQNSADGRGQLAQNNNLYQAPFGMPQNNATTSPTANKYANINAAHFASLFSQSGGIPPNLNPHALSAALQDYTSQSVPNSAASSPGQQHRRLHGSASGYPSGTMTGTNTPGGHSRVAASAITGKRLNWSEMICQTIAESQEGHLVIQDLFTQMCAKFPEIHEWAFGKDWEARVKNRIKSTLSIKGNLFIKVPRPSSASGKGSWWTLSQEAKDAWKEGRVHALTKSGVHSRSASQGRVGLDSLSMSAATSRANSRAPSRRGSPVSSRGPSSHHAQNASGNRNSQSYVNFAQSNQQSSDTQSNSSPSAGSHGESNSRRQSPSSVGLPSTLGMSPITFSAPANQTSFGDMSAFNQGLNGQLGSNTSNGSFNMEQFNQAMMNGNAGPNAFSNQGQFDVSSMAPQSSNLYSISPYNAFSTSATAQHLGTLATPAHLGGPQSMPFPHAGTGQNNSGSGDATSNFGANLNTGANQTLSNFNADPTLSAFAGLDLSNLDSLNNPFGSMAGGYTSLSADANGGQAGAQPTPIPGRGAIGGVNGGNSGGNSGSGGRGTPSASSFNAAFYSGPSPADSTGSTSAFFAYTPAMQAADAASGASALGPLGGEGSKKRREGAERTGSQQQSGIGDFALPPTDGTDVKDQTKSEVS